MRIKNLRRTMHHRLAKNDRTQPRRRALPSNWLSPALERLEDRIVLSHFRGAAMIPSVDDAGVLTLTSTSFWRNGLLGDTFPVSGIDESGNPAVTGPGLFGAPMSDVGPTTGGLSFRTFDTSDSRFTKVVQQHTLQLPGPGVYTISATSCCRVGGIQNAFESDWTMNSTINWDGSSASTPINFNFSAIQSEVVRGSDYSGNMSAVADAGLALTYDQALNQNIFAQPPGFTIDANTGDLSIPAASTATYLDNFAGNPGADYAFSGNIFARDGAGALKGQVEFDWLFDAVNVASNRAPTVDDASTTVNRGATVVHTFTGSDPEGAALTWSFVGLLGPGGAAPGNAPTFDPATQLFTWDTGGSDSGTWIAQVRASDPAGLTDIGNLTITINPVQTVGIDIKPPVINIANQGVIPVQLLSSAGFDPSKVDVSTVRFAGAMAVQSTLADINGDGILDLILHFRTQETDLLARYRDLVMADLADGTLDSERQTFNALLEGETVDGEAFAGVDSVDLFLAGRALDELLESL